MPLMWSRPTGRPFSLARQAALQGYNRPNVGRHYAYLRVSEKEPFDILDFTPAFTAIVNTDDLSWSLIPEAIYAGIGSGETKPAEEAKIEAHRKYIDIQVPLAGVRHERAIVRSVRGDRKFGTPLVLSLVGKGGELCTNLQIDGRRRGRRRQNLGHPLRRKRYGLYGCRQRITGIRRKNLARLQREQWFYPVSFGA